MAEHPKGRGRATPIFRYIAITRERFDIFSKLFLQWVGIHEENSPVHGRWSMVDRRHEERGRATPIF